MSATVGTRALFPGGQKQSPGISMLLISHGGRYLSRWNFRWFLFSQILNKLNKLKRQVLSCKPNNKLNSLLVDEVENLGGPRSLGDLDRAEERHLRPGNVDVGDHRGLGDPVVPQPLPSQEDVLLHDLQSWRVSMARQPEKYQRRTREEPEKN